MLFKVIATIYVKTELWLWTSPRGSRQKKRTLQVTYQLMHEPTVQ